MKIILAFFVLALSCTLSANAQPARAETAESIMKKAYAEAARQNKNVFIMYHASWCGWCHKMDKSMNDPACKKFFDDHFVIRHLVVDESDDKKDLENPGADEMRIKYHGDGEGIPFWLVFDQKGNLLADSKMRKEGEGPEMGVNTGCPAAEKEVDYFISVLKKTTKLKDSELEIIRKRFRQNEL